jgi:hypothetical protein
MAGILWSQQEKLAGAVAALQEWTDRAQAVGVRVTQLNLTLLDADNPERSSYVIFEWDEAAGEYAFRTAGD